MRKWWKKLKQTLRRWNSVKELTKAAKYAQHPREKMQEPKRQTRYTYNQGPMYYLGQQIVKAMQDAGYPAKILYCYRSPEHQHRLYQKGRSHGGKIVTNANAWQSPHQYSEAVDIIHPSKAWDVSETYWETLASVVRITEEKYGVQLTHGHYWKFRDSAHIELSDWKKVKNQYTDRRNHGDYNPPTKGELWLRFEEVLPAVARAYKARQ